jgi:hypothetical protein
VKSKIREIYPSDYSVTATTDSLNAPTELAASSTNTSSTVLDWTAPNDNARCCRYNVYNGMNVCHYWY